MQNEALTIGSLFSGIGGLELGLERAGLGPVRFQVEKDAFCRSVLAKHWPAVPRFGDVRDVAAGLPRVHVLCGGFPCQDVSSAGKGAGLEEGERSGLWFEFARLIAVLRPSVVVVENVASGKRRWLPAVRRHLHLLGYDSDAYSLSAFDVGAPHKRARIFVVAHSLGVQLREQSGRRGRANGEGESVASDHGGERLARDADRSQCQGDGSARRDAKEQSRVRHVGLSRALGDPHRDSQSTLSEHAEVAGMCRAAGDSSAWTSPPVFRGVDDGIPRRLDRLRSLGNAVVPQCAEAVGRMILSRAKRYDYSL